MENKFSGAGANKDTQNEGVLSPSPNEFSRPSPKSSLTLLKERNLQGNCVTEESNLPSKNIAELWEKPLKFTGSLPSNSPKRSNAAGRSKSKVSRTPSGSRRNILPPMKLFLDQSDTDESPSLKQQRLAYRRSLSYPTESSTPITFPKRQKLFSDEISPYEELNSKTIPESSGGTTAQDILDENSSTLTPLVKKLFSKSQSDSILTSCNVKRALEQIENNPNLIGDGSRSHILPLKIDGKHPDLKEITGESLAKLLEGVQSTEESVKFKIIDCRYPYEYEGGHIRGSVNFYTKKQIREQLLDVKLSLELSSNVCSPEREEREILIFHCEFSSHRGPALYRYLRDIDRATNVSSYPFLFFPEIYVLYGGYQTFFEKFPNLCEPRAYVKMTDQEHGEQYRRFKSECKFGLS